MRTTLEVVRCRALRRFMVATLAACGAPPLGDEGHDRVSVPRANERRPLEAQRDSASTPFPAPIACTTDADCPVPERNAASVSICEDRVCTAQSRDVLFDWAKRFPEIAALNEAPSFGDILWAREASVTLFVDARDVWSQTPARCVPVTFEHAGTTLAADVPERFGVKLGTHDEWFTTLVLAETAVRMGSFVLQSHPDGSVGTVAEGRSSDLGHALVGPTDRALRYRGLRFEASVECIESTIEQPQCTPARCTHCSLHVAMRSLEARGFGSPRMPSVRTRGGPCVTCPPDPLRDQITRINHALEGRVFVRDNGDVDGPTFHRDLAECTRALTAPSANQYPN